MSAAKLTLLSLSIAFSVATAAIPPDLAAPLATVRAVGPEGRGNEEASKAWRILTARDAADLPALLEAMGGANALAKNWLRAAVDTIAARELAAGKPLPTSQLIAFLHDRGHDPQSRWLAYQWIVRQEPARADELVPGMLDDPSNALRRQSVARLIGEAANSRVGQNPGNALAQYHQALKAARDVDQVEAIAKALRELGETVDLREVFGWITRWKVIGPFDNTGLAGFARVFPPETELRLEAGYEGKAGTVTWRDHETTDPYGKVDLNKPLGVLKEVTGYAFTEFISDHAGPAEIRLGCKNAWKIWVNGDFLFGRDEYHRGAEIDQYRLPVQLRPGKNAILVKLCQNEEVEDWTVEWEFQLRLTDPTGQPLRPGPPEPRHQPE